MRLLTMFFLSLLLLTTALTAQAKDVVTATPSPDESSFGFAVVPICDWDDISQTCTQNGDYAVYFICDNIQMEAVLSPQGEFELQAVQIRSQLTLQILPVDANSQEVGNWTVEKTDEVITASYRKQVKITFSTDTDHAGC